MLSLPKPHTHRPGFESRFTIWWIFPLKTIDRSFATPSHMTHLNIYIGKCIELVITWCFLHLKWLCRTSRKAVVRM